MREVVTKVYKYDELSDKAKEKARQWYRKGNEEDSYWSESVIEDATTIADLFGLDLKTRPVKLMGGGTRMKPCVNYSGFWSQGDGACFEGVYHYKKGGLKAVKEYAPTDTELHKIVAAFQDLQRANFYKLRAGSKHTGHYYHSGCMSIWVEKDEGEVTDATEEAMKECFRDFADWIYKRLESEWEYQNSDSAVEETILANEYEFTEEGEIA